MNQASLYDIKPLPAFLYNPGTMEWLISLAFLLLIALLATRLSRGKVAKALEPFSSICRELEHLHLCEPGKTEISAFVLSLRRYLSFTEASPFYSYSKSELEDLVLGDAPTALKSILQPLLALETELYSPTPKLDKQLLRQLENALREHHALRGVTHA